MRSDTAIRVFVLLSSSLLAFTAACSDPDDPPVIVEPDAGTDADDTDADTEEDADVEESGGYCSSCTEDSDCESGHCLELQDDERACGIDCDPDAEEPCPENAYCYVVDEEGNTQCAPTALTCDAPCEGVVCPEDEFCAPTTGECVDDPRICDTGCQFDAQCGDPTENVCLSTGAPDGETICTTRCDPDADDEDGGLECPSDFFCATAEEDDEQGFCYPLERTCRDRCADVDCAAGNNCDPFTGECVEAIAGACEQGCEIDAECGGADDRCLNLGVGDGSHCWRDCTDSGTCPDGYECTPLLGLTSSLCIPPAQQCQECYDADCFPEGVCDPTTGECIPHPENCNEEGCDDGQICEPVSARCVDVGRTCQGESWAVDCDNVVTRCTTQRSGTEGTCSVICQGDDDCPGDKTCTETIYGDLCMGPQFGGAESCGTITPPDTDIGAPCDSQGDPNCSSGYDCIEVGGVPGFCSTDCTDDGDCAGDATCGVGPGGDPVCIPPQCRCAGSPALPDQLAGGWEAALDELGLTTCDLMIPRGAIADTGEFDDLALVDPKLADLLSVPPAGMGTLRTHVGDLDGASAQPGDLVAESASLLEVTITEPSATDPGTPDLIDALSDLSTTAGGSLDTTAAESETSDLPADVEQLAANLVSVLDDAYAARDQALDDAGIDGAMRQTLFGQTHRLLLPAADGQDALDLSDPDTAAALEDFPLDEIIQIGADLTASIQQIVDDAGIDPAGVTDTFSAVVDTPAGLVVIGDTEDDVYDTDTDADLDAPLALVLEIGGDDTYRLPVGANQSVENAASVHVDLAGADTYTYPKEGDAQDGTLLMESDAAGRKDPSGDDAIDGPVSLSETARQGAGRLGFGLLFDRGAGIDSYETLRIGQGAGILGVGAVIDTGSDASSFEAEAFAQGAGLRGVGLLYSAGGDDTYRIWHAGQGFGAGAGAGLLFDAAGGDDYTAVVGDDAEEVLYHSDADAGSANRSLAQGAAAGGDGIGAGIGVLRDAAGSDVYTASSYTQGFGEDRGVGVLADADGGDDYQGRGTIQGSGIDAGTGALFDGGGDDEFNQRSSAQNLGQGTGDAFGWGVFAVEGGSNDIGYSTPGGAVALDGGFGFALFDGGPNDHDAGLGGGLGIASFNADGDSAYADGWTAGIFVQTGADAETYSHPQSGDVNIGDDSVWRQDDEDVDHAVGVGVDE